MYFLIQTLLCTNIQLEWKRQVLPSPSPLSNFSTSHQIPWHFFSSPQASAIYLIQHGSLNTRCRNMCTRSLKIRLHCKLIILITHAFCDPNFICFWNWASMAVMHVYYINVFGCAKYFQKQPYIESKNHYRIFSKTWNHCIGKIQIFRFFSHDFGIWNIKNVLPITDRTTPASIINILGAINIFTSSPLNISWMFGSDPPPPFLNVHLKVCCPKINSQHSSH